MSLTIDTVLVPKFESVSTKLVDMYVDDPAYVFEQKMDGIRVLLDARPDGVVLPYDITHQPTRNTVVKRDMQHRAVQGGFPHLAHDLILDTELVNGTFWVFDVPWCNVWLGSSPFAQRRQILESLGRRYNWIDPSVPHRVRLTPQAVTATEKAALWQRVCEEGGEGLMIKRIDGLYPNSNKRLNSTVKCKRTHTAECMVLQRDVDGSKNAVLGLKNTPSPGKGWRDIAWTEVGKCSMIGRPDVMPGDVIEVEFLYVVDRFAPKLVQPRMLKPRPDRHESDCLLSQLDHAYTTKAVLV